MTQLTFSHAVQQRGLMLGLALGLGLILFTPASFAATGALDAVNQQLRAGKLRQASLLADRHLAKNPRDPHMRFLKALIQQESGQMSQAIKTYTQLAVDFPELPEPHVNLATIYASQRQLDKERAALEAASQASRSLSNRHEKLGDVYAHLAMSAYGQSLRLDDADPAQAPKLAPIRQLIGAPGPAIAPRP